MLKKAINPPLQKKKHSKTLDVVEKTEPNGVSKPGFHAMPVSGAKGKKEQPYRNSDEKLRLVMNAALDAIICIDTTGAISFWNQQAELIFGWTEAEVLGQPLSELIIPEQYRKRHNDGIALYLKTGKGPALNKLLELSAIRRNGDEFPIELTIMPIKQGGEEFFCAFVRDIAERKKAEIALQTSYNEKNTILESIADAFFAVDVNWVVTYWNKVAEKMLLIPKSEIVGHNLWEVFSTSIDSESYRKYHEAVETNQVVDFEDYYLELDKWFEISAYPSVTGLSVYFKDITERKKSEAALLKVYEEKNTVLERIDDGFFALDKDSIVTYWNKRAEILLDTKKEDLLGKNLHEVFNVRGSRIFYDNYVKALNEKITIHFEGFSNLSQKWFAVSAYGSDNGLSVYFKDVTEQKNAGEKIKESELRYRSLIEQATDSICILDASGKFIEMNSSGCQMFGYSKEEILQLFMTDVLFEEDLKIDPIKIDELKAGKTTGNERRIKRKDGTTMVVELSAKMIEDGRILVFGRDITERKKAGQLIIESELRYRSLIEQATEAICIADSSLKIIDMNPSGCQMLGYSKEEFLRLKVADVFILEDLKTNPFKIHELASGKVIRNERRIKRKDGVVIEVEINGKILEDGRFILFGREITERKQAELLIKESESKYRTLFEQNMAGVYQSTINGVILSCNPAFAKMLKYDSPAELLEINASALYFSPEDRYDFTDKVINQEKIYNYESVLKCKDGSPLYFIENISRRKNEVTGEIFFDGIMIDITEKKQAELGLKESNERYNLISQATNDMVWDWNLITGKMYRNKEGWKKIFRTGDKEIENETIADWDNRVHPEDKGKVEEVQAEIQKSLKDFFEVECRMLRDDGTCVYIHDRGHIIRNEQGEAIRLIGATQDITARKEAELHVATSELRFRSLVQKSTDLINIVDEKGFYTYCSPAVKKILGYEPEFIIGKNAYSFIHPDDIVTIKADMVKIKTGNYFEMPPFRFKNEKGEWRWLESTISIMTDNPAIGGYVFNSRDITERKIAEEEINKLTIIARETVNAVIITNPQGEILWVNEAFTRITEFEPGEVIGKKPGDFLQGDETNLAVVRFMRNKLKNVEPFMCDIVNYTKSGKKYWLRIQSQPQYDESGELKYFFAIETDITKEKEAEEILKASEERFRYLFNNNPASIFIWDINTFKILEVNDTAIKVYGYPREEFLSKTSMDLSLPEDSNKIKHFASIARQKSEFRSDVICTHLNRTGKEMYMNISSHLIQFKGQSVILALATNITDKVILELELEHERQAKHQEITDAVITAQEKERQQLGSELHDNINQILAGSRLYLGLAQKELKKEHHYLKETDTLISSAINEIRTLSHSLIPPSLNESELIEALNNIIESTHNASGIMITLEALEFDETHISDKLKLAIYRIIQEQFHNILKYAGAQKVIVRLVQDNEKLLLSIKDDGVGFVVGKKVNGVGLVNIKTRASLFNGELTINSSPGNGCELRVMFN